MVILLGRRNRVSEQIVSSEDIPFYINGKRVFIVFQGTTYDTECREKYLQAPSVPLNGRNFHYWKRITEVQRDDIIFNLAEGFIRAISISRGIYQQVSDKNRVYCDYYILDKPVNYRELKTEIITVCKGFGEKCPFKKNGEGNQGYLYDSNKGLAVLFSKKILDSNEKLGEDLPFLQEIISSDDKSFDTSRGVDQMDSDQQTQIRKYSDTLLKSKNIILHGAPGTGKTFLAKQLAATIASSGRTSVYTELSDDEKNQIGFVQFHPSYDYTDFVEGLRPKLNDDGSMGYELREGIFMEFVDKARKNYEDSHKSKKAIEKEQSAEALMAEFFGKYWQETINLKTKKGNEFFIIGVDDKHININIPGNATSNKLSLNKNEIRKMLESDNEFKRVKDISSFFNKKNETQDYSYDFAIYKKIKEMKVSLPKTINQEALKKYVFIIDEINRGEISKIFGELFYSIDPGYRGKSGEISTQYSNLHEDPNDKFYIPDNVYIIGTMNDIDRSVDSFDFAMRRRFRFIELKADEMTDMLNALDDKKDDAERRMKSLNKAIVEIDDLNENYQIGAAYFIKLKEITSEELWDDYLEPLLQDYIQGMPDEKGKLEILKDAYFKTEKENINANLEG